MRERDECCPGLGTNNGRPLVQVEYFRPLHCNCYIGRSHRDAAGCVAGRLTQRRRMAVHRSPRHLSAGAGRVGPLAAVLRLARLGRVVRARAWHWHACRRCAPHPLFHADALCCCGVLMMHVQVRLARHATSLKLLFNTLMLTIPALANVGALLVLTIFMCTTLQLQLQRLRWLGSSCIRAHPAIYRHLTQIYHNRSSKLCTRRVWHKQLERDFARLQLSELLQRVRVADQVSTRSLRATVGIWLTLRLLLRRLGFRRERALSAHLRGRGDCNASVRVCMSRILTKRVHADTRCGTCVYRTA
jgi:hypothetical protein